MITDKRPILVSVHMPAFNHEAYVREAVESVWNQTFRDIELIAIDDGSSDGTARILREMAAVSPIPMTVVEQPNAGVSRTLNRAIAMSRGKWIACLASDDRFAPNFIERHLAVMAERGDERVVQHTGALIIEADGRISGRSEDVAKRRPAQGEVFEQLVENKVKITAISMFYSRALFEEIGGFDETLAAEDIDLFLRLARRTTFHFIDESLVYSRYTPGSLGKSPWVTSPALIASLAKHEDRLGSRLPLILAERSLISAAMCFELGNSAAGRHWFVQALRYGRQGRQVLPVFARLMKLTLRAYARRVALTLFGRARLVRIKRRLQGNGVAAGQSRLGLQAGE